MGKRAFWGMEGRKTELFCRRGGEGRIGGSDAVGGCPDSRTVQVVGIVRYRGSRLYGRMMCGWEVLLQKCPNVQTSISSHRQYPLLSIV